MIKLFRPVDEWINLTFPIFLLILIVLGISLPSASIGIYHGPGYFIDDMLSDILLLNITHNAFTVMMILSFPEMRTWLTRQNGGSRGFFIRAMLIFSLLLLVIGFGRAGKIPYFYELIFPLSLFFPIQHGLAQSLGLSLMYNGKSQSERPRRWLEKSERYLIWALIGLVVAVAWTFRKFSLFASAYDHIPVLHVICIAVSLGLVVIALLHPRGIRFSKALFALRYPVWALSVYSPLAIWATRAIHGLEYLFVTRKMASNSKFAGWKAIAIYVLLGTLVFGILRLYYLSYVQKNPNPDSASHDALFVIMSISTAFSFLHYYFDRQLFLMRQPANRELVAPLLRD